MTARDYFSILEQVIRGAREQGILLPFATANPLIPEERLAFLASATATIYIQNQRRGAPPAAEASPAVAPATSQGGKGGGGQPIPEVAAGSETSRPPTAAPAIPATVPPESQGTLPREGDTHGDYTYHKCPSCGHVKPYKKWWPGAKCWDCYKAGKP